MKTILLTGANGYLGSNIAQVISNDTNYQLICIIRKESSFLSSLNCTIVLGNFYDSKVLESLPYKPDIIIHSASKTNPYPSVMEDFVKVNLEYTKRLVAFFKDKNIDKFIYISTANVFTNGTIKNPGTENSDILPWLKNSPYAYSKYLAHNYILKEYTENKFPVNIVAPTFMLGGVDYASSSGKLFKYVWRNKFVFYPRGGKNIVHVKQVANTVLKLTETTTNGEVFLSAGENISYKNLFKKIRQIKGENKSLIPIPNGLIISVRFILKTLQYFSFKNVDESNFKMLLTNNYFSNKKSYRKLKISTISIDKVVEDSANWMKKEYNEGKV